MRGQEPSRTCQQSAWLTHVPFAGTLGTALSAGCCARSTATLCGNQCLRSRKKPRRKGWGCSKSSRKSTLPATVVPPARAWCLPVLAPYTKRTCAFALTVGAALLPIAQDVGRAAQHRRNLLPVRPQRAPTPQLARPRRVHHHIPALTSQRTAKASCCILHRQERSAYFFFRKTMVTANRDSESQWPKPRDTTPDAPSSQVCVRAVGLGDLVQL